jgi:hypothetical protein
MVIVLAKNFFFTQSAVIGGEEFHAAAEQSIIGGITFPDITLF